MFNISPSTTITHYGLAKYLKENLSKNFYDFEEVITNIKKKYPEKNSLYLKYDGHWNSLTHSEIYNWLWSNKDIFNISYPIK